MPVTITELLKRADTGVSVKPFLCTSEEGRGIYVKTAGNAKDSLIAEWIGSKLAQAMGIACAEATLIDVPQLLARANNNPDWSDFHAGIGFGSYYLGESFRDLQASDRALLDPQHLAELYLFDYWIKNQDRQMGPSAGNPNTLVNIYDRSDFCIIDHDNAFDSTFDLSLFKQLHIGRDVHEYWLANAARSAWLDKVRVVLPELETIWQDLPEGREKV